MVKRRSPIEHSVGTHMRNGKRVDGYDRGQGTKPQRSSRIVGATNVGAVRSPQSFIISTQTVFGSGEGLDGRVEISKGTEEDTYGGGAYDFIFKGNFEDLFRAVVKRDGKIRRHVEVNDYKPPTYLWFYRGDLNKNELNEINRLSRKYGLEAGFD